MPQLEQTEIFGSLIFWSVVSFGILLYLLRKYVFPPVLEIIEEREKKIRGDISDAETLKKEAGQLKMELQERLQEAHEKSETILQLAQDEARKIQDKTLQETQAKCKQLQNDAENEIKRTRDKLLDEIRGFAAVLTIASTEKILKKTIGEEDKTRLVNESIEEALKEIERRTSA